MKSTEYIGRRMSRPNAKALLRGQGKYVDDISLPGMLHVFFIRNPYGHALIGEINKEEALKMPGAVAVVDGAEMLEYCEPWRAELTHLSPMNTVLQYALPPERSCYQGEPVVAVVAESRALAEDAAELVVIDWQELPPVASLEVAQKEGVRTSIPNRAPIWHGSSVLTREISTEFSKTRKLLSSKTSM